ncbi:PREDICTED: nuclear factor 7, brain-like [Cyprinodon variegatus]|uniref:nuclear factor 7, brain-like n=1 Tax=Cyprinodon variegatus TaxID=28743 RepID=UPI00074251EB|nr:PREDICTED: nuclear factor 7, brain-like [Cyprinodon variegatus]
MAAAPTAPPPSFSKSSLRDDLTCAICCDLFREPVMLSCMHHFCKACISRYWRGTTGPVTCPQCRKEFRSKQFQTNYLVAAMVEKVRSSTSDTYIRNLEKRLSESLENHNARKEDLLCSIRKDKDKMDIIKVGLYKQMQHLTISSLSLVLQQISGPASLTFDADTAHPSIHVSRDKTVAVECDVMTQPTSNSKRFLQCVNILAAQSFQSGRHYWEVEVGSSPKWDLGVASETVDRHARIKLSPENGYWTLRLRNGEQYWAGTQPWSRLQVASSPQRIGVYLDCDERKVAFYDADDMSLLCLFSKGPRGKVFPFFSPCITEGRQKPHPMKLLHYPSVVLSG